MKIRQILSEAANKATEQAFIRWLKLNNLKYELVAGGKGKDSNYYEVEFDNGIPDFPEILKIRFSNHPAGYRAIDLDTYQDHINSLQDIFKELENKFGLVINGNKYKGQKWKTEWDSENNKWIKKEIEIKRG